MNRRPSVLYGILGIALGAFAVAVPLEFSNSHYAADGWAITSAGICAVSIAVWYRRCGGGPVVPAIAGTLGVAGTILCLWTVVAVWFPGTMPALPQVIPISAIAQSTAPITVPPASSLTASGAAPAASSAGSVHEVRIVPPLDGAAVAVAVPEQQMYENLKYAATTLATALSRQRGQGTMPMSLAVARDGTVTSPGVVYPLQLADYMTLSLEVIPTGYTVTVRDAVSGVSVSIQDLPAIATG